MKIALIITLFSTAFISEVHAREKSKIKRIRKRPKIQRIKKSSRPKRVRLNCKIDGTKRKLFDKHGIKISNNQKRASNIPKKSRVYVQVLDVKKKRPIRIGRRNTFIKSLPKDLKKGKSTILFGVTPGKFNKISRCRAWAVVSPKRGRSRDRSMWGKKRGGRTGPQKKMGKSPNKRGAKLRRFGADLVPVIEAFEASNIRLKPNVPCQIGSGVFTAAAYAWNRGNYKSGEFKVWYQVHRKQNDGEKLIFDKKKIISNVKPGSKYRIFEYQGPNPLADRSCKLFPDGSHPYYKCVYRIKVVVDTLKKVNEGRRGEKNNTLEYKFESCNYPIK